MSGEIHLIKVESEEQCWYCGRRKMSESENFYKVFLRDKDMGIVICELCKGGLATRFLEGSEKTYATHLTFYIKHSLLELEKKIPDIAKAELNSAIESYEDGEYVTSFRSIGWVAEWLTERLFVKKLGESTPKEKLSWEDKLGRLLDRSRREKRSPDEAILYQLFSLKWFRNIASHPSEYKITGEDVRLGLTIILYLFHQACSYSMI